MNTVTIGEHLRARALGIPGAFLAGAMTAPVVGTVALVCQGYKPTVGLALLAALMGGTGFAAIQLWKGPRVEVVAR